MLVKVLRLVFWSQIFNVLRSVGQHAHSPTDSEYQCVYVRVSGQWESEKESDRSELGVGRPEFPEVSKRWWDFISKSDSVIKGKSEAKLM